MFFQKKSGREQDVEMVNAVKTVDDEDDVVLEHQMENIQVPHTQGVASAIQHDAIAPEAVGGLYEEMPKGYYWSGGFLGTVAVCICIHLRGFTV